MSSFLDHEGDRYLDFSVIRHLRIQELDITLRELIHIPTGAQVLSLANDDTENVFCLSFKTLPTDSTGVAHILEHTVLCGSRKFPVKDPFFGMSRRSLSTFMNAMTGSDFTCYPAASQVKKDFYNLLEVYIDAVFHPTLKELSFLQEGVRLELIDPNDPLSPLQFGGIVYNEMKGALSSIDSRMWHTLLAILVPDLPYAFNSGGDPKEIPHLTYRELIEFHEANYHPSRCLFYFYGNFPLKDHLDFIQKHALHNVQRLPPIDGIGHQVPFKAPVHVVHTYPFLEEGDLEEKHIHVFGWLTAQLLDQAEVLALLILDSALMDTDASPLKSALLASELCVQVDSFLDTEMTQIPFAIVFRGCKLEDVEQIEELLFKQMREIAKAGIPLHLVESSIHQLELSRTEIGGDQSPFGLSLFMRSVLAKQHGCPAEHALTIHEQFKQIRERMEDPRFFPSIIEKFLINNPHLVRLTFSPDPTLSAREIEEEKERLEKIKLQLNEEALARLSDQAKQLQLYQAAVEGQKLDCLPKVSLEDVPAHVRHFPLQEIDRGDLRIFHHEVFTNHILYADLIFDLPYLSEEELFYLQLFLTIWPSLGVGNRTYAEQLEFIHAHTGGLHAHASLHIQVETPSEMNPSLQIHGIALSRNVDKLFSCLQEMVTLSRLDETKRIKELIKKLANSMQHRLSNNAMRYASQIATSSFSTGAHINELWYGLSFYQKIQSLAKNLSKELPIAIQWMLQVKDKLLYQGAPHLVISCDQATFDRLDKAQFYGLTQLLRNPPNRWLGEYRLPSVIHQARIISSPVAYTAQGLKAATYLDPDSPALQVSTLLLEHKTLHHRIREMGGAYGAGATYNPLFGNFYLYAYRDPHIATTLKTFEDSLKALASGNFDKTDLEQAKLGIIQQMDQPTSPGSRGMFSYILQRDGKTSKMRQHFRNRVLTLGSDDIEKAISNLLTEREESSIVIFAGKELLEKELPLVEGIKLEILPV